jgi:hypothetical protein
MDKSSRRNRSKQDRNELGDASLLGVIAVMQRVVVGWMVEVVGGGLVGIFFTPISRGTKANA